MAEGWLKEVGGCDLLKGVAREGKPTGQGLVKYTRERVDVGAGVGFPGTENAQGHVRPRADGRARAGYPGVVGRNI
jgi:hypothetical protein